MLNRGRHQHHYCIRLDLDLVEGRKEGRCRTAVVGLVEVVWEQVLAIELYEFR
jgi:hypothetical protein